MDIMKPFFYRLTTLLFLLTLNGCSSDDDAPTPTPTPIATLTNISPNSGPKETQVTISGNHFGHSPDAISVYFNDVEATVQTVSNTEIISMVPARSYTGLVKVIVNGTQLIGPEFEYIISDIQVSTIAGSTQGFADGTGTSAQFYNPVGITVDNQGNIFVADSENNKIRKITSDAVVSTIAGSNSGFEDGQGANAQFSRPEGITSDSQGNLYVADSRNHKIRKITSSGEVSTLAGNSAGFLDGTGANAQFNFPTGITIDNQNNLYVTDMDNNRIRKITPNGVVSTLAGSTAGFADGTGPDAQFNQPMGITSDSQGNLFITDNDNFRIRKITPNGTVTTLAGSTDGFLDGPGSTALFSWPTGIAIDNQDNLYVADFYNNKIRKITPNGMVSTIAGSTDGFADGIGSDAQFSKPIKITIDSQNNLYITDYENNKIRKITQE